MLFVDEKYSLADYNLCYFPEKKTFQAVPQNRLEYSDKDTLLFYSGDICFINDMIKLISTVHIYLVSKKSNLMFAISIKQMSTYFDYHSGVFSLKEPDKFKFIMLTTNITEPVRLLKNIFDFNILPDKFLASEIDTREYSKLFNKINLNNNYFSNLLEILKTDYNIFLDRYIVDMFVRDMYSDIKINEPIPSKYLLGFEDGRFVNLSS